MKVLQHASFDYRMKHFATIELIRKVLSARQKERNSLAVLQKVKYQLTIWPRNSAPRYVSKRSENTSTQKLVHKSSNSIIHDSQTLKAAQMSINELMDKQMCFIHTMGYYLAMKSNKVLILPIMWMNFYDIMLSERSQTQKVMYCMISFIWIAQNRQIHGDRKQIRGCQGLEVGKMRNDCLKTTGFLFRVIKIEAIRWPEKNRRLMKRSVGLRPNLWVCRLDSFGQGTEPQGWRNTFI